MWMGGSRARHRERPGPTTQKRQRPAQRAPRERRAPRQRALGHRERRDRERRERSDRARHRAQTARERWGPAQIYKEFGLSLDAGDSRCYGHFSDGGKERMTQKASTDDPESVRQWLLQSWVSVCFSQRLINACHVRNSHYEMAQCAIRKKKSLQLFSPYCLGSVLV